MKIPSHVNTELNSFEKEIMLEMFDNDGLLVMARGLGVERMFSKFMELYCHSSYFVIIMNVGVDDSSFFIEALRGNPVSKDFHILDSSSSVSQRNSLYNKGGIFLVTMRILVTDMLSSNIPCEQLTGILVHNAQHICECNQERFVLRMYRERNKTGFIKAFSDDPVSFTHGFCKVQAIMRSLFVRQLFLWPRFHSLVHETLDKYQPNVEEVSMQMSATMKNIQLAIFDLIQCCLQELKRTSKYLDPQTLTIESAILPSFHFYLRSQLQDVWNEIGYVSRQLVYDLKILQNALTSLCRYDCITFSRLVESIRWSETKSNKAGWILTDSADRLFALAKQRLYATEHEGIRSYDFVRCSEENVKLNELRNLLQTFAKTSSVSRPNIIIALDESCCIEIKQFLLSENGTSYVRNKIEEKQNLEINHNKPQVNRKPLAFGQMYIDQYLLSNNQHTNSLSEILLDIDDPPTAICPLSNMSSCQISLIDVLEKCRPLNIIMYDCHLRYIRQIELYCVLHPDCLPTVHCLTFVDSAEEQIYLSTLEREKAAMDELIRQKSQIVIPDDEQLLYSATKPSLAVSKANATRIGGFDRNAGTSDNVSQQKIIIDVRELRSELPSTLYKLNIQLIPVTLEVGDYVLSPEICVERKSLSDLIGSMSDGRLYTQILMMCRHYEKPVLLIEYNKEVEKFSLKDSRFDKRDNSFNSKNVYSKLVLLTIHFPKLRIVWSSSPMESAEIFHDLKMNRAQPDKETALSFTTGQFAVGSNYNETARDLLLKIPGVNFKNHRLIMDNVANLKELSTLDVETLAKIIDSKIAAKQIVDFMNFNVSQQ